MNPKRATTRQKPFEQPFTAIADSGSAVGTSTFET